MTSTQSVGADNTEPCGSLPALKREPERQGRHITSGWSARTRPARRRRLDGLTFRVHAGAYRGHDAAQPVGTDNAHLNGTVNPNGLATTYHFEWGTDNALSSPTSTATVPRARIRRGSVNAAMTSLIEATTYYFRVVATNSTGTSQGRHPLLNHSSAIPRPPPSPTSTRRCIPWGPEPASLRLEHRGNARWFGIAVLGRNDHHVRLDPDAGDCTVTLADTAAQITTFTVPTFD